MNPLPTVELLKQADANFDQLQILHVVEDKPLPNYYAAMKIANRRAQKTIGDNMLVSWYDRDRDFESPQHIGDRHPDSAIPGYVDYGLSHEASLVIDVEDGRFVFFYMKLDSMQT